MICANCQKNVRVYVKVVHRELIMYQDTYGIVRQLEDNELTSPRPLCRKCYHHIDMINKF